MTRNIFILKRIIKWELLVERHAAEAYCLNNNHEWDAADQRSYRSKQKMCVSSVHLQCKATYLECILGQCVGIYVKQFFFFHLKPCWVRRSSLSLNSPRTLTHLPEIIYERFPPLKPPQLTVRLSGPGSGTVDVWTFPREFSFKRLKVRILINLSAQSQIWSSTDRWTVQPCIRVCICQT